MAVWTVFEPEAADEARTAHQWAEGLVFVPERISWSALLLAPLVLLRHRLWLALVVYLLAQGALLAAIRLLGLDGNAGVLLLVANVAVAVMLPGLRHARLAARGFEEAGTVVAPKLEAAEQRYLDARLGGASLVPLARPRLDAPAGERGASSVSPPARPAEPAVLGLFPEARR